MRNVHARISVLFRASSVCLHNTSYRAPCSRMHSDNCSTRTRTLSFINTIARRLHSAASKHRITCWPSLMSCSAASAVDSMPQSYQASSVQSIATHTSYLGGGGLTCNFPVVAFALTVYVPAVLRTTKLFTLLDTSTSIEKTPS